MFDVEEILAADEVYDPRSYDFGVWSVPFDAEGQHQIVGATFDPDAGVLYVALGGAGQIADYDKTPLILTFKIPE